MNEVKYYEYDYGVIPGDDKLYRGICFQFIGDDFFESDSFDDAWYGIKSLIKDKLEHWYGSYSLNERPKTDLENNNHIIDLENTISSMNITIDSLEQLNSELIHNAEEVERELKGIMVYKDVIFSIKNAIAFSLIHDNP